MVANNFSNWLSTGSSLKDAGLSALVGLGDALQPKGRYYVQANWKGNGLANTGLGYLANPNYRDFFSAGQALASLGARQKEAKNKQQKQLANLWSTGENINEIIGPTYQLSQRPYFGIDTSLPTTVSYSRPSWLGE